MCIVVREAVPMRKPSASAPSSNQRLEHLDETGQERSNATALRSRTSAIPFRQLDDASYIALAEALADEPMPLLTADARLARAVAGHADVPVILAD